MLSPTVYLLMTGITGANDSIEPTLIKCLSDSGCFRSCIDLQILQDLGIAIEPQDGYLTLADKSRKPRVGITVPTRVTLLFWGGDSQNSRPAPIDIVYQFEVLPSESKSYYQAIFGRDLMALAGRALVQRGANPESLFPYATGIPLSHLLSEDSLLTGDIPWRITGTLAAFQPDESEASVPSDAEAELILDEAEELSPARMEYITEAALEEEYSIERERIMNDLEIRREIEINERISEPITHDEAIVHLRLSDDANPRKLSRLQYAVPQTKMSIITEKVQDWLNRGKIEKAPYLSDRLNINNPLLCVPKKSGGEVVQGSGRVCIDPRLLNSFLYCDDKFEIPQIRRQLEKFAGSKIFGELDLEEAFLQFLVDPDSRHLLCFTWNGVQYRFTCMPFGVKFMTSFCHRFVSTRIREAELSFCDPFVDNLPFASNTWEEHRLQMLSLLRLCNQFNLKVKTSAIKVGHSKMKCLGHVVSADGVSMDPRKIDAIANWPRPTTGAQMESFLGFTAFIRQHIRHYSELSAPLVDVKHNKTIEWTDLMDRSFETLKQAIKQAPILRFPDYSRPFYLASDASNLGCGGILYQPAEGQDEVTATNIVAICAKKWGSSQVRYSAYKKELFGLVYCLRKFHQYIWGRTDTIVYTDHKPLTYMFSQPELPVVLQQWLDLILDYSFTIRHRPGILNLVPDQLSRMYAATYGTSTWGVPPNIRFEGKLPEDDSMSSTFPRGERSALDTIAVSALCPEDESEASDSCLINLRIEMEKRGKTVPPPADRERLIQQQHALGHFGRDAIFKKLYDQDNLWWPGMRSDIQAAIRRCDACARFVVVKSGFKPAQFITAPGPWHHVQFDCAVKLPESPEGFTTLLVFIDVFSGFVLLYPIKTTSAVCVAEKLWLACCTFGFPAILQSDNGTEFSNEVVEKLVEIMKIDRRFIAPYNPRCDGKVERAIGVVMGVIKKLLQGADQHWPLFCPLAQLSVNNRISSVTRSTPFSLMFARENSVLGPWDAAPDSQFETASIAEWKAYQARVNEAIYPSILDRTLTVKKRMVKKVDKKRRLIDGTAFPDGCRVALKDPKKQDKREPTFLVHYQVVRTDRNGNLVVREDRADGKILERRIPPDQLKRIEANNSEAQPDTEAYEVERILKHRGSRTNHQYLVLWKGYPIEEATWQSAGDFLDSSIVRNYWKSREDAAATE